MPAPAARMPLLAAALLVAAILLAACSSSAHRAASTAGSPSTSPATTTRSAPATTTPSLDPLARAWSAPLDGAAVAGRPVIAGGRVFVATEGDDVYALDRHDGRVLWQRHIGTPLTGVFRTVGCGDIDPLGITSTPAVDPATGTVYVVGEVVTGAGSPPSVHHELVGLEPATGAVVRQVDADPTLPPGETPLDLLQRPSLAVANGRVYVSYGGNYGDCGTYHGWLVGIGQAPSTSTVSFEAAPDGLGGAIWEPGGPAVDAAGDVYVTTGNADPQPPQGGPDPEQYTESAVKLPPTLGTPLASFKDRTAGGDEDLSTSSPLLLPRGQLFVVGKTDIGYRLDAGDLHEVGAVQGMCGGSDPDGADALDPQLDTLYVPCRGGGIQEVNLATTTLGWRAGAVNSTPVLVGGTLWALDYPSGTLEQLAPTTGQVLQRLAAGPVPNFATPTIASGLLVVGTDHGVVAYAGPAGPPAG